MIIVKDLKKNYRKKCALKEVSFSVSKGVIGVLGPNGSGKTTLFRILAGILGQSGGEIYFQNKDGVAVLADNFRIGYISQAFGLIPDYTLWEHMEYFACLKGIEKGEWQMEIEQALEAVHLSDERKTKCRKLSGGMVRRAGIAQTLLGKPDLILLDEPTVGLDPEERLRFQDIIRERKVQCPVLLATHLIEDVMELCNQALVLSRGELLFYNEVEKLASLAEGRVHLVPEGEFARCRQYGMKVKNQYGEGSEQQVRFLLLEEMGKQEKPGQGASEQGAVRNGNAGDMEELFEKYERVPPQIEDGYLYLLRAQEKRQSAG